MTKTAVVADLHLACHKYLGGDITAGLNQRARWIMRALYGALQLADDKGCDSFVIAGDLFDVSKPSPALIGAVVEAVVHSRPNMPIDLLLGNHDMESGDENALMPFSGLGNVHMRSSQIEVVTVPTIHSRGGKPTGGVLLAPFCVGPASDWLRIAIAGDSYDPRGALLITHVGLIDDDTPPFLRGADDAIHVDLLDELCDAAGIPCVIAGNWHKHKVIYGKRGTLMVQAGALVPTGFDNPGSEGYGTVTIYDHSTNGIEVHEIPGPRFLKVAKKANIPPDCPTGMTYAVRCTSETDPGESSNPNIHVEWAPPSATMPATQDEARATAQTADSIAEAVAAYVDAVVLDPSLKREDVKRQCWTYL